jgi:hypothetical protein
MRWFRKHHTCPCGEAEAGAADLARQLWSRYLDFARVYDSCAGRRHFHCQLQTLGFTSVSRNGLPPKHPPRSVRRFRSHARLQALTPEVSARWLLSELDPDNLDRAFGLCDLGLGFPELGYVSIRELSTLRTRDLRLRVERDRYFRPDRLLSVYAAEARAAGRIIA